MRIVVQLPDDIETLSAPGRAAQEALAIQGYRTGAPTQFQAAQVLGLTRLEFEAFLKERNIVESACDVEDLEQDVEALRKLRAKGLSAARSA